MSGKGLVWAAGGAVLFVMGVAVTLALWHSPLAGACAFASGIALACAAWALGLRAELARLRGAAPAGEDVHARAYAFAQRLIDMIPQPVYVKDAQSRYLLVNDAFCRERMRSREELVGGTSWAFAPDPNFGSSIAAEDLRVLAGETVYKEECVPHMYTGAERFRLITKGACFDVSGAPVIVGANFDVTPWRQAERAVARTRDFLQLIFDAMPNPVLIKDEALHYVAANPAARRLFPLDTEIIGKRLAEIVDAPLAERLEADERILIQRPDGARLQTEFVLPAEAGQAERRFITHKVVGRDGEGARVLIVSLTDVSALHEAREELQASLARETLRRERTQEFVQRLIDTIPEPVYVKDANSRYQIVNDAFARDFNLPKEQIPGIDSIARVGADDPEIGEAVRREDLEVLAGAYVRKEDHRPWLMTGAERHRVVSKGACLDADGLPVIVVANFDVTRWHQAERELTAALEREQRNHERTGLYIQRLIDVIPYPVYVKDAQSRFLLVNAAFARERGRSPEELKGLSSVSQQISGADVRMLTLEEDQEVVEGGGIVLKEEYKPHSVTGEERYRVVSKACCEDPQGDKVIVVSVFDVTPWRLAERQLAQALEREKARSERIQQYVQRLIDVIPQPVYVKDADSRYLLVNEAFARDRGLSREVLIGRPSSVTPEAVQFVHAEDSEVLAGYTVFKEEYRPHPVSGLPRYRLISKGFCLDYEGRPVIVGANFDVTSWRVAEARLLAAKNEAERANAAKSLFLTNMSHELRTPMHGILSFSRLGVERALTTAPERLRGYFERIQSSGERLMSLVDDLLDLAKLEAGRMEMSLALQDLRPLVQEVIDEFEILAANASVGLEFAAGTPAPARVDAKLFCQVVRNLLSNAVKFSPAGTQISLRLDAALGQAPSGDSPHSARAAIELRVADRGPGIPEGELESVFSKFVQSSQMRGGAGGIGLGLAISREIVAAHKGLIYARNRVGGGTEFVVSLPAD